MIPCSDEEHYYKLDNIVLSSCHLLRHLFVKRWKIEAKEDWIGNQQQLTKFIEGKFGKNVYRQAPSFQKTVLKSKPVDEWDMSLLSLVIVNFGGEEEKKRYSVQNDAVKKLRKLRNDLAHSGNKKVSRENYVENVHIFRSCMQSLGVDNNEIQKLIDKAGVTSSLKALEYMNELHRKAEEFLKNGELDKALESFSEAINVPSLLPINLGTAYEKRAEYFLSQVNNPSAHQNKVDSALLDATKVVNELNEFSWLGHYLCAQCYRWKNELDQAIHHYERALAISPAQEAVKDGYETCKVLIGKYNNTKDHLRPVSFPMSLQECMDYMEKESGIKYSKQEFLNLHKVMANGIKGQHHVFHGHQYFNGWDVPQSYTEAIHHYTKAARMKNPEGMYRMGFCYHFGYGVKQDLKEALRIYRETAEMDPKTPGGITKLLCNEAVAAAQHALALMYHEGVGVELDYAVAAFWYKKAMDNGLGFAANNLGLLCSQGRGIPQDLKMAEFCWKQGVHLKDEVAPIHLFNYYMDQLEPEMALNMVRIGRELGNAVLLKMSDEEINRVFAQLKSERVRLEPELVQFEKSNKLHNKGLTFNERLNRRTQILDPGLANIHKIYEKGMHQYFDEQKCLSGVVAKEHILEITERAARGSVTASRVLKTLSLSAQLNQLVKDYMEPNESLACEIVHVLYGCVTSDLHLLHLSKKCVQKLKSIVAKLFENCTTTSEDDMKIRLCYAVFNLHGSMRTESMYAVEILKIGVREYPKNVHFYYYLSYILGQKGMYKEGKFYAEQGLKLFPANVDLLFCLATHLKGLIFSFEAPRADCIAAYKKFLCIAANDHRMVPDAYYHISMVVGAQLVDVDNFFQKDAVYEQVNEYFLRGQQAEKNQLPCYLPYHDSFEKCMVKELLGSALSDSPADKISSFEDETRREILQRKQYLMSPTRKNIILMHRQHLKSSNEGFKVTREFKDRTYCHIKAPPKLKQRVAVRISKLTPINLQEMNPNEDKIYENRVLDLLIMDEMVESTSLHLIAEDENGDVTRLSVYNVARDKETLKNFRPGCGLRIINPFMRVALDGFNGIRNDEPKCIVFLEKVENMCRFCCEGNASRKCSKCKRPYCSRECQELDWKKLKHKLVCSLKM